MAVHPEYQVLTGNDLHPEHLNEPFIFMGYNV